MWYRIYKLSASLSGPGRGEKNESPVRIFVLAEEPETGSAK
jgi:hypothetical protein